ncbi:MAG: BlaI/MecI/CopY family transcriptional regulator [Candidatus Zixiibacteriota bacterium]
MTASFYFDPDGTGSGVFLGPLEARLMELVWDKGALTVKQALYLMGKDANIAYSTIMTVLTRLAEKQILKRSKEGKNFVYEPTISREDFIKSRVNQIEACLSRNFGRQTRKS